MDHSSTKAGKWCHSWCYRGVSVSHGHQHFFIKLQFRARGKRSCSTKRSFSLVSLILQSASCDSCLDRQDRIVLTFHVRNLVAYLMIETIFSGQFLRQPSKCSSPVYVLFMAGLTDFSSVVYNVSIFMLLNLRLNE
ncbi:hypothetical protein F2Q69_00003157 [Brassica cretica]|uniref:Uncharacterized protein n=1 Tax=Brassica cretica TaxID=69181 RepID=A0A8S9PMJ8_BRACR|nr:hypothetical protein F2Q69_00003157 [Brassica cretica]